jgi:hypothetical protein
VLATVGAKHLSTTQSRGAANGQPGAIEDVGIDHGGLCVLLAEELLEGANVIVGFQKVRGKAVSRRGFAQAEDVGTNPFGNSRRLGCGAHGFLQAAFVDVVAADDVAARVYRKAIGRKDILPAQWVLT